MTTIKFFGQLREAVKVDEYQLALVEPISINAIKQSLAAKGGDWSYIGAQDVLAAVNHTLVDGATLVTEDDEVAFFPPVTGG